jgi:hypothetical protein
MIALTVLCSDGILVRAQTFCQRSLISIPLTSPLCVITRQVCLRLMHMSFVQKLLHFSFDWVQTFLNEDLGYFPQSLWVNYSIVP